MKKEKTIKKHKPLSALDLNAASKKSITKLNFDGPIASLINKEELMAKATTLLTNDGIFLYYKRNKQIVAIFMFRSEEITDEANTNVLTQVQTDAMSEHKKKILETSNKKYKLILDEEYIIDEFIVDYDKIKPDLISTAADYTLSSHSYDTVVWKDEIYKKSSKNVDLGGLTIPVSIIWFIAGFFLFGYNSDNWPMGICMGLAFALCFGSSFQMIQSGGNKMEQINNTEENEK